MVYDGAFPAPDSPAVRGGEFTLFMPQPQLTEATQQLQAAIAPEMPSTRALQRIRDALRIDLGYAFREIDESRPWGGFYRMVDEQTDKFLIDFCPGLSQKEARLGRDDIALSPKIMVWLPGKRLSWQYHDLRAERWHFLTGGLYYRSTTDGLPLPVQARPGDVVQIAQGERHRGMASLDQHTLVAEVWQHTNPSHASDEADITRIEDDFGRAIS